MLHKPRRSNVLTALLAVFAGGFFFFMVQHGVSAQTPFSIEDIGSSIGLGTSDLKETILNIIRWFLGILTLLALVYVGYGGFLYLTSNGEEQKIEKAKKTIINAVIGLAIVLLSWAIVIFAARVFGEVTTGGSGTCQNNATRNQGCEICSSGTWIINPAPPVPSLCTGIPPTAFRLDAVATSYVFPPGNAQNNVTLCSNVLQDFNNFVDDVSVAAAVIDPLTPLRISEVGTGIVFAGTWQTLSDTVTFKHNKFCTGTPTQCLNDSECSGTPGTTCDIVTFLPSTQYELQIPRDPYIGALKDRSGDLLLACALTVNCDSSNPNYFAWRFTTGVENDIVPPFITSTYPVRPGPTYPDTNVDRQPILEVNFSEAIDPGSVMDPGTGLLDSDNVFITRITAQGGTPIAAATATDADGDGKVDADKWNVTFDTDGFRLSILNPLALEPFTWYRITVQNIEDLCGNGIVAPEEWEFQTNDAIASFKSVYPTGANQCPDTKIAAVFGTTMFQHDVQFIVSDGVNIDITLSSPEVTGLTQWSDGDSVLRVLDPYPGGYKQYELTPFETSGGGLPLNSNFTVEVKTNREIDAAHTLLETSWGFSTSTPETCACQPLITAIDPKQGPPGQCATVQGYCFTGTTANPATPTSVKVGGQDGDPMILGTPTNKQIVTTVSKTLPQAVHPVTVGITYSNPAFGTLISNNNITFEVNSATAAQGPCLVSLSPNQGYTSTPFDANGERFGTTAGLVDFGGMLAPIVSWADTKVKSSVPVIACGSPRLVKIVDSGGNPSNGLNFDVMCVPPDQLAVVEAVPTCGTACINTLLSARFNKDVDVNKLTDTNIRVRKCQSTSCEWNLLDAPLTTLDINPLGWDATNKRFTFSNSVNFDPNTSYRVLLSGGGSGITSSIGELLNMNFDENNDGNNDVYSWTFKTKDDPTACSINSVDLNPAVATIGAVGGTHNYIAQALASPDTCNPAGQPIDVGDTWSWNISVAATPEAQFSGGGATLTNAGNIQTVEALTETIIPPDPDYVTIEASASGFSDTGELTIDVTWCNEVTDCEDLDAGTPGLECPGSTCDLLTNKCKPVINSLSPASGDIGTWVTVDGCYFDRYDSAKSKVIFNSNKVGLCLPTAICGSCASQWTNRQVIVEVPDDSTPPGDDAVDGAVRIETKSGYSATSSMPFDVVAGEAHPGICKLVPNSGEPGVAEVGVYGTGFDAAQGSGFVEFAVAQDAPVISWANDMINVTVPTFAETGLVTVTQNSQTSNGLNFTVIPPACPVIDQCLIDADCAAGEGCSVSGCCAMRPDVVSTNPADGATNVCRNAGIVITFDQPMNQATLLDPANYTISPGSFTVVRVSSTSVTLGPGLMVDNTDYTFKVLQTVQSALGVSMAADRTFTFKTGSTTCDLAAVDVQPPSTVFVASGMPKILTAQAYEQGGSVILPVPGLYDWRWGWTTSKPLVASFSPLPGNSDQARLVTQSQNGITTVTATASLLPPNSGSKSGAATITLNMSGPPGNACGTFNTCTVGCLAGQGCATGGCCAWAPSVVSTNPIDGATNVCRNTGILVQFDQPMSASSLGNLANYSISPGSITGVQVMSDRVLVQPSILTANVNHTLTLSANIQSNLGVPMASNYVMTFTTSDSVCELDAVDVSPVVYAEVASNIPISYGAIPIGTTGGPIVEAPGLYSWSWAWVSSNIGVGNFDPAAGDSPSQTVKTGITSGSTNIRATATVDAPGTGSKSGVGVLNLTLPPGPADLCPGSTTCSIDTDCIGTPGLPACGASGCCVARPSVASTNPTDGATDVCRNAGISITFDRPMQKASLQNPANYAIDIGTVTVSAVTPTTVYLIPNPFPLNATTTYTVTVKDTVLSTEGVGLAGNYVFDFTTSDSFCDLDYVTMTPTLWQSVTSNETKSFVATTYAANNNIIISAPGVYSWEWHWITSNASVADYTADFSIPGEENKDQQEAQTGNTNGKTTLRATATVDQAPNISRFATALVELEACHNPWSIAPQGTFIDSAANCATGSCTDYDFTLFYCLGNNAASLLPDFTQINIKGSISGSDILKQYLFKATGDDDAIGIRILANTSLLAPDVWFYQQFPYGTGSPQSIVVDGYPAVRDGRTVYVASSRYTLDRNNNGNPNDPQVQGFIFLISYNQDASNATKTIYNKLLNSWRFNAGMNGSPLPGLGPVDKLAVAHDMMRLGDLSKIARELTDYRDAKGTYPALNAGSFITGITTSRWNQSWNATLGNALGATLPVDPVNSFYNCPATHEPQSCWYETTKNFQCNTNPSPTPEVPDSHVYLYDAASDGSSYTLYANLEYTKPGGWAIGAGDPCAGSPGGSSCSCFNFNLPSL
ncbi:MAG: Ig-like domain-containing protein [Patescibacteria group bacterium]|jgi:hypothetical protein